MLVGTEGGALHALRLDEKEKRERLWAPLLQLEGSDSSPIRGCHQQVRSPHAMGPADALTVLTLRTCACDGGSNYI